MNNKSLLKNISFFTFFNVINSAIPFLLLPILTTYLSPADYGMVDIFYNISLVASPLIGLSIVQSISRYYFDEIDLSKFITTVFTFLLGFGSIVILVILGIALVIDGLVSNLGFPPLLIVVALIYTLFSQVAEIVLVYWRVSYQTAKFGIFRITKTAADLGLSIVCIVGLGMGWTGRILPQVSIALIFGIIAAIILSKKGLLLRLKVDKAYKKEALSFSTPLIFHTLGGNLIGFSDRFFILFMLGLSDVGIYSVGYQIGMVIALVQNSFNQAWVPFFFKKLKENVYSEKLRIVKITYFYFGFMLLLVLLFYFCMPYVYRYFIGSSFESGAVIVFWILLGYAFNGMYKMLVNYLFYLKKTKLVAFCTLGLGGVNLILNYFLIRLNGIEGAAQATAVTFLLLFIVIFMLSKKMYKMPWNLKPIE